MNKRTILFLLINFWCFQEVYAQTLSLESCQELAKSNYPLTKQFELIEKSKAYSIENAQIVSLPQVTVSGYATYQSDILTFPFAFPEVSLDPLRQDQHRIVGEINQPITDLWNVRNQKDLALATGEIEAQKLEVELFKLKERVNQVFF